MAKIKVNVYAKIPILQEPRPLQDCSSDDNDDHPDPDYNDDDYILPYSNPPSDDEYIPDNESAPSRKQKPCPASKKRKSCKSIPIQTLFPY